MRKIDTRDFRRATQRTSREVNRQIVLSLIREHQPVSRADLARLMRVRRGALTDVVADLVARDVVREAREAPRGASRGLPGRRPTLLTVGAARRAIAIDVRPDHTLVALADLDGRVTMGERVPTPPTAAEWIDAAARVLARVLARVADDAAAAASSCDGIAVVVPGIVEHRTGRVTVAPRLGWRDVDLRAALGPRLGLPIHVVGTPVAGALARLWRTTEPREPTRTFAYVAVSDDVSVGLVVDGAPVHGDTHTGAAFGHITLDADGPVCACGRRGCWEAFACNAATVSRYVHAAVGTRRADGAPHGAGAALVLDDVIALARSGDPHAVEALAETGYCIGRGLATVISAFGPGRIYVGGEVAAAWPFVEPRLRAAIGEQALTDAARATPVLPDHRPAEHRVLGAVALVVAPAFAATRVA